MTEPFEERIVEEHRTVRFKGELCREDISYLTSDRFGYTRAKPFIVRELKDNEIEVENTSFAGVIQLRNIRLLFSTKITANLYFMLNSLKGEHSILLDDEIIIDMEKGSSFFDVIGRLFLNELDRILRRGFCKRYIKKEERGTFIKGRILIEKQLRQSIKKETKAFCRFNDLTYDNLENQILLRAASLLIPMIRFSDQVRWDLLRYSNLMREEISLLNLGPDDCERISLNRINDYYSAALRLAKAILRRYFIRTTHLGISAGFNFIVNMNKVYEDFISEMLSELIRESPSFSEYSIETQKTFDSLVREKGILTRPDIIIKERARSNSFPIIIDTKYKKQENNADFYQVIAYALAIPSSKAAILLYPMEDTAKSIEPAVYTIAANRFNNKREDIKLYVFKIDLLQKKYERLEDFQKAVKLQLKNHLLTAMESV